MFSTISPLRTDECTTTTETGTSKSGIDGIGGIGGITNLKSFDFGPHATDFRRSASCTLTVTGCPSRLTPNDTVRPGGVSRIILRNCAPLSTLAPFMVRMTSCSLSPALPAGASWSTIVTSTPRSSFNFKADSLSVVTSVMSTPKYAPVLSSSPEKPTSVARLKV